MQWWPTFRARSKLRAERISPADWRITGQFLEGCVAFAADVAEEFQGLFFDPQTSGGFLASIAPESVDRTMSEFEKRKIPARVIGEVVTKRSPLIEVI